MAEQLAVIGADFQMHYATRSFECAAFIDRIEQSRFADRVQLHFDDGDRTQRLELDAVLAATEPDTHLYVCGPKGFMDAVLGTARAQGWAESNLHWEFFSGENVAPRNGDEAFDVQLASSGRVITVAPDKTVTQALSDAGVEVMVSCEQGVCGTCVTRVIEGIPDHRDCYLTPQERATNDQFTPCCSRSKSARLVLDL
jgi:vanillate O-demethylase ferredoxin subunit